MNAATANLLNSVALIGLGAWGYVETNFSPTALIPVGFGVALALMFPGIQKHSKIIAHIAVFLTLVVFLALFMPLKGAIEDGRTMAIVRVALMIGTSALAMFFFVKSFVDARKAREAEAESGS